MKNLFDPTTSAEVQARVRSLTPQNPRQWGKMSAAQAMEQCALALEWAVNDTVAPPGPLPLRIIGRIIKPLVLNNDKPMRRNSPTTETLVVAHQPALEATKERLCDLIDRFSTAGPAACTTQPHPFFGKLKPQEWAVLMYKHTDHHLRQFNA